MRKYELMFEQKAELPGIDTLQEDIANARDWEDAFWIGKFIYSHDSSEADKLIIKAYERAFNLGLNVYSNRECFLTATQQSARMCFQFGRYVEAGNHLIVLEDNYEDLPDWVHLYFAASQIHTDILLYWAENPKYLFDYIDKINKNNPESVQKRKFLFQDFLNRVAELSGTQDLSEVDSEAILNKAEELGVKDSNACLNFEVALGLEVNLAEWQKEEVEEEETGAQAASELEQEVAELKDKLAELQEKANAQELQLGDYKLQAKQYKQDIAKQHEENAKLKSQLKSTTEELQGAKEREYASLQREKTLESKLSGHESDLKQLKEQASALGKLKAEIEELNELLAETENENTELRAEAEQYTATIAKQNAEAEKYSAKIDKFTSDLQKANAEIQRLRAAVPETQTEQTASPGFTAASFLRRNQKILIIGESRIKANDIKGVLKKQVPGLRNDHLEILLNYEDVKSYTDRIKQNGMKYAGIIAGPCPHKTKGIGDHGSFIQMLKDEKLEYPPVEEARTNSHELKITKTSIRNAMERLIVRLQPTTL